MGTISENVEFAPLRPLEDFLLESARFQIPNLKDLEKWGKRVANNLLYYQTNYFLLSVIIFIIFGVLHPVKMVIGSIVMVVLFAIVSFCTRDEGTIGQIKRKHPIIFVVVVFCTIYYVTSTLMGSLVIFLLALLVPFCVTFIHASLRLRSIKNKISNRVEKYIRRTPMAIFLEQMGLEQEMSANFMAPFMVQNAKFVKKIS